VNDVCAIFSFSFFQGKGKAMSNLDSFVGEIVFTEQLSSRSHGEVLAAAEAAGIPEKFVRELSAKNVFVRAMRELRKADIVSGNDGALRDKIEDSEALVVFQFSKRYVESQGAHYDPAGVVKFHKEAGCISSNKPELEALARDLFESKRFEWTSVDLNTLCNHVVEEHGKRVMPRHGVYFVPVQASEAAKRIRKFLLALNLRFFSVPIGKGDRNYDGVQKAVAEDIRKEVRNIRRKIAEIKASGEMTKRKARSRLRELRKLLRQYRDIALSSRRNADEVLDEAGEAGKLLLDAEKPADVVIAEAASPGRVDPLVLDLLETAEEIPAGAVERQKIMEAPESPDGSFELPVVPKQEKFAPVV